MSGERKRKGSCSCCGGYGCATCEPSGLCPGCGELWRPVPSPLSTAVCAARGVLPLMCIACGKHQRRPAGAVQLEVVKGGAQ